MSNLFFEECETYTAEQLRPKAQRLNSKMIDDLERRYVDQGEEEEGSNESDDESMVDDEDRGNDRTVDNNSFSGTVSRRVPKKKKVAADIED